MIRFHLRTTRFLLTSIPFAAILLLGTSYLWDFYKGDDCGLSKAMLGFYGVAVRWYSGVLIISIVGVLGILKVVPAGPRK